MGEMMNEKKVRLARWILDLEDEALLDQVERTLAGYSDAIGIDLTEFARPVRENITVADLMQEQHADPIDPKEMDAIATKMDIQEPIEDLLAQLTP